MQIRYFVALSLLPQLVLADESAVVTAPQSPCSSQAECVITPPVPRYIPQPDADGKIDLEQIRIASDSTHAQLNDKAEFNGDVAITQGERRIMADQAILNQKAQQLDAKGHLVFQDPQFTITADSLVAQMHNNSAVLDGAKYWLTGQQVHGDAKQLEITPDNNLVLTDTDFTTCPADNPSWLLQAGKIKIDSKEEWGEVWDAKLRLGGIPVFYVPYMTIPVSDKRKTGFLFPSFSTSSSNGVEISTPYYWNIAPEYDLTFNPTIMTNRGLFLKTEFRYLAGEDQSGQLNLEYLGKDRTLTGRPDRYLYHWQQQGSIDQHWRVLANYTDVSDNNYFNDFNSDINQSTDNQLNRVGEMSYLDTNWNVSARVQDIKVLGEDETPYQVMPQVNFNYWAPATWHDLDFKFNSEMTRFNNTDYRPDSATTTGAKTATRLHMEPSITLPLYGPAGSLTSEVKLMQTNYWQDDAPEHLGLKKHVSRTIPEVRIHGKINFERSLNLFSENYKQTLEPQAQYLYVGYQDQSDIGLYDTALLQDDYYGLFRDRRFSGLDRIADANQVSLGLTTRLLDDHNQEQFKFSFGQIFYIKNSRVSLFDDVEQDKPSSSVLAAELDAKVTQDWYISSSVQYDTKFRTTKKSEATLDFRPSTNKLVQFSYRYVPDLLNTNTNDRVNISQAGFRTAWPITDNVYFVGNWYYDLNESRNIEIYTGLQYESCCYAVRLSYHHNIKTNYDDIISPSIEAREQFDSGFYLNFVIKGLGGSGPLGVTDMLNDGLFNYRKPLYLRN
ncbi:LPS assembly protein LptD [Shewanella marina]|uniref:LPS assembly protein LptD n=1 Tax=Shewanella marina TaxID=487319 RepID=UPI00047166B6|nr:LPS assembly protein LptD [Shewanella marina]